MKKASWCWIKNQISGVSKWQGSEATELILELSKEKTELKEELLYAVEIKICIENYVLFAEVASGEG